MMTQDNTNNAVRLPPMEDFEYINYVYTCLLADICELSKVPIGAPDKLTYEWLLILAPKLDKELLKWIEGSGTLPDFPEWIQPLVIAFTSSLDGKYLRYIRQLLLFCYKIELEPNDKQIRDAQEAFENVESSVEIWNTYFKYSKDSALFQTARKIVGRCIYKINWKEILPSHGPGAVSPPAKPHAKSRFLTVYPTIDSYYPYYEYFKAVPSYWPTAEEALMDMGIEVKPTITSVLTAVPKDSRGPRLICVHPKEAIWIQQGCRRNLERAICSKGSPCHGRINFQDQGVNGKLALASSSDRRYVTLDLKEASDRISCELVEYLFGTYAYNHISCSRASEVRLLDGRVIMLKKWAPMGNALTFPVQSLVFFSLVQAGIRCKYGVNCTDIYVFGDDIIFPSEFYDGALAGLTRAGLVPNVDKTFRHGFFRESCGVDAYRGVDVTPHRLKRYGSSTVSEAISSCTLAKAMAIDGYRKTADSLYRPVQNRLGRLPLSNNPDGQGLYRYEDCSLLSLLRHEPTIRFNRKLQRLETRILLVQGTTSRPPIDSWWNLQDSLVSLAHNGLEIRTRSSTDYAVPHRVRSKWGWIDALYDHQYMLAGELVLAS